ncbi:MAG: phosphoenolpyruvate--protein phosphotransferase [Candidatus Cloacimonetes bacterium]|nr:phosphoenolpyruvate--protein phosphotransferase [Candidatus Cloacimonadota bacterium]MBL7085979.1 phosphoenolpyruvate--protein phosphotransferase [Candidatus Cloacimonadota bacterium]
MKILKGYPIASGLNAGKVEITKLHIPKVSSENIKSSEIEKHIKRFDNALEKSISELQLLLSFLESGEIEVHDIVLSHKEMLKDKVFIDEIKAKISDELLSADYSVHSYIEKIITHLSHIDDEYLSLRKEDFREIRDRLIRNLALDYTDKPRNIPENKIIAVKEVSPGFLLHIKNINAIGFIAEKGAPNSHSAIIAKSMGIPVIFNLKNLSHHIHNEEFVIINGSSGIVILQPTDKQIEDYEKQKKKEYEAYSEKVRFSKLPTITKDKHRIQLMGNIEFPEEAKKVELQYADGIGLFRTEFLYFAENNFPSVQKQYEIYRNLIDILPENKPIYIRTFDVGGDKVSREFDIEKELNPALGCKGIRFLLRFSKVFKEQIIGILKASAFGNLKIMLPMISTAEEVNKAKKIINKVKKSLQEENIQFNKNIEVGIMIEVPSAALMANQLAEVSDFFSIGTNDLTQYVLAADRNNETLTAEFNYFHPAVLQLIEKTINAANRKGIHVCLCGEMAGNPIAIPLLLGIGLRNFSVNADNILSTKQKIGKYTLQKLNKKYQEIKYQSSNEIKQFYSNLSKDKKQILGT